ncbi:permeability factor 2-like [Cyclopterus lumpus]|uniref:permeability factor 2-like n=1 Tax=Cyclopterus lumpus TaxID=8103 RepID=UPI0014867983|nr:permeability factor 2-like [Cyclopterus lumpus]
MNTAIRCIVVLLACATMCTSKSILNCRCVKTSTAVNASLIHRVEELEPRPYCNRKEVIVVLKDGSSRCLDPKGRFAKAVLLITHMKRVFHANKMNTTAAPTSK